MCGASGIDTANGGIFILHVYGDDPTTPGVDEGASASDALTFEVYDPTRRTFVQVALTFANGTVGIPASPVLPPVFVENGVDAAVPDIVPPALVIAEVQTPTNLTSVTLHGTTEAGASLTVSVNGAPAAPVDVTGTSWSYPATGSWRSRTTTLSSGRPTPRRTPSRGA